MMSLSKAGVREILKDGERVFGKLEQVGPPYRVFPAVRQSPDEGGLLDVGIVGTLPDGREVVVGEVWVAALALPSAALGFARSDKVRIHSLAVADAIVAALNGGGNAEG